MFRALLFASTALLVAASPAAAFSAAPGAAPAAAAVQDSAELAAFFDAYDKAELAMSPLSKASRGIRDGDYGKWDDYSDAAAIASQELDLRTLAEMRARFDRARLSPADQLSYDLFEYRVTRSEALFPYRRLGYVFDQMNGAQSDGPAFLINIHRVDSLADAEA
jgi:uncharacterized protein (DUF885 family)